MKISILLPTGLLALVALACASAAPVEESAPAVKPSSVASEPSPAAAASEAPAGGEEPAETYKNTLRWTTASEVENFGFDVYRGDSEEGPFERLTESPIQGAGTIDTPSRYEYEDDTIDPYAAYWYYVESISIHGVRENFTPVFRAKPKLPAEGESRPGDGAG